MNKKIILVTGAAGYLGSNICEYLLDKKYSVVGIDNFNNFYSPKVKRHNIKEFKNHPNFKLYEKDLLDTKAVNKIFKSHKPPIIVHMAAWAGVTRSISDPVTYIRNNIEATVKLADIAKNYIIDNFIFASTSSIYGNNKTPFKESMSTDQPLAPYPATKKACEVMLYTYVKNFGLPVTILRIFNPLGPRQRPDLALTQLIKSCLYGTKFNLYQDLQKTGRDYTHVSHLLELIRSLFSKSFEYEIFNVGNSKPVPLGKLIQTVEKVVGNKANIVKVGKRMGEMRQTYADISKAKKMLGYNPTTSIKDSVEKYYKWFMIQEDWYKKGDY